MVQHLFADVRITLLSLVSIGVEERLREALR
jgi:hypothetical protein